VCAAVEGVRASLRRFESRAPQALGPSAGDTGMAAAPDLGAPTPPSTVSGIQKQHRAAWLQAPCPCAVQAIVCDGAVATHTASGGAKTAALARSRRHAVHKRETAELRAARPFRPSLGSTLQIEPPPGGSRYGEPALQPVEIQRPTQQLAVGPVDPPGSATRPAAQPPPATPPCGHRQVPKSPGVVVTEKRRYRPRTHGQRMIALTEKGKLH
jgi:hypothetical protein